MNTNILRVFVFETLQLVFETQQLVACLFVVKALTLKLRLNAANLNLKVCHLSFQIGKLVLGKGKPLTEYRVRAVLGNQFINAFEDEHFVMILNASKLCRIGLEAQE